jgi:hypothetical protein
MEDVYRAIFVSRFFDGRKEEWKFYSTIGNSPVCVDESKNVLVVSTSRNKVRENNSFLIEG